LAASAEFARFDTRLAAFVEEMDPRTATETVENWERMLGLPDEAITQIPVEIGERRAAVIQKLVAQGGQDAAYFAHLALACGYVVTIDDLYGARVLRAGFRAGSRAYGTAWAYAWRVDVQTPAGAALPHADLERVVRRAAPRHTVVIFNYL
jgi:uncharacterized protein YmfQ (DUF2313 family)